MQEGKVATSELQHPLHNLYGVCQGLPLPPSFMGGFRRLRERIPTSGPEIAVQVGDLEQQLLEELDAHKFFAVYPDRTQFYGTQAQWFSLKIKQKFPEAARDMRDACQCYALDQWTASVYHSVRVLEMGLRAVAKHLGVTLPKDLDLNGWKSIEDAIRNKTAELQKQAKTQAESEYLVFLSKCSLDLGDFRNAWRNVVCHGRGHYDQQGALDILTRVRNFMDGVAARATW